MLCNCSCLRTLYGSIREPSSEPRSLTVCSEWIPSYFIWDKSNLFVNTILLWNVSFIHFFIILLKTHKPGKWSHDAYTQSLGFWFVCRGPVLYFCLFLFLCLFYCMHLEIQAYISLNSCSTLPLSETQSLLRDWEDLAAEKHCLF